MALLPTPPRAAPRPFLSPSPLEGAPQPPVTGHQKSVDRTPATMRDNYPLPAAPDLSLPDETSDVPERYLSPSAAPASLRADVSVQCSGRLQPLSYLDNPGRPSEFMKGLEQINISSSEGEGGA